MYARTTTIASLTVAAAISMIAPAAEGQIPSWNRRVESIAVLPPATAGAPWDVRAVWSVSLGEPASTPLDLSTEVAFHLNGVEVGRQPVLIQVDPGSGLCGPCGTTCGNGQIDGVPTLLLCSEEAAGTPLLGCFCRFPSITTPLPMPATPGDEIMVILYPAPGALPDSSTADDIRVTPFQGEPIYWNRRITSASLTPTAGGGPQVFDVRVEIDVATSGLTGPLDITPKIDVLVNGAATHAYVPPCGPWIMAPSNPCEGPCDGSTCGVITCGGEIVSISTCQEYEGGNVNGCGCLSGTILCVIPAVPLDFDDEVVVILKPVPGALPELPGFGDDEEPLCSTPASNTQYGAGKPGIFGVPVLSALDLPLVGQPTTIELSNARPGALPILFFGLVPAAAPFDGGTLLVNPLLVLPIPAPVFADGTLPLHFQIPGDPSLCGLALYHQMMIPDPSASGFYHLAMTNGLERILGS